MVSQETEKETQYKREPENLQVESVDHGKTITEIIDETTNLSNFMSTVISDYNSIKGKIENNIHKLPRYLIGSFIFSLLIIWALVSFYKTIGVTYALLAGMVSTVPFLAFLGWYVLNDKEMADFFNRLHPDALETGIDSKGQYSFRKTITALRDTLIPNAQKFILSMEARVETEHVKENFWNAIQYYNMATPTIREAIDNFSNTSYEETSRINRLIKHVSERTQLHPNLAFLVYYDYMKKGEVQAAIENVLRDNKAVEAIVTIVQNRLKSETRIPWVVKHVDSIVLLELKELVSAKETYTIQRLMSKAAADLEFLERKTSEFIDNLNRFNIEASTNFLEYCEGISKLEDIRSGNSLIECIKEKYEFRGEKITRPVLELIYHYDDAPSVRSKVLKNMKKEGLDELARFIRDIHGNLPVSSLDLIGTIVKAIGDYRLEAIGKNLKELVRLLNLLREGKEALTKLNFKLSRDPESKEYILDVIERFKFNSNELDVDVYLKSFAELFDWKLKLEEWTNYEQVLGERYSTLIFIAFCNGLFEIKPDVDQRKINFYFSKYYEVTLDLLHFLMLKETKPTSDFPEILLRAITHNDPKNDKLYLEKFKREFVTGWLPTYGFLVQDSNKNALRIVKKTFNKPFPKPVERIVRKIFSKRVNESYIRSLIVGRAVQAYIVTKNDQGPLYDKVDFKGKNNFSRFIQFLAEEKEKGIYSELSNVNSFVRIRFLGYATRIGIVPDNMSYYRFVELFNRYLNSYFKRLISDTREEIERVPSWDITPVDTTSLSFSNEGEYTTVGYIDKIRELLYNEPIERQLGWIISSEKQGEISEELSVKDMIKNFLESDETGYLQFFEDDLSNHISQIYTGQGTLQKYEQFRKLLTKAIGKAIGGKGFTDTCIKLSANPNDFKNKETILGVINQIDRNLPAKELYSEIMNISIGVAFLLK